MNKEQEKALIDLCSTILLPWYATIYLPLKIYQHIARELNNEL